MTTTAVIGTVTITDTYQVTNRGFATASWYEVVDVTPGTYDITARYDRNERTGELEVEPESYRIQVAGTIVSDFFGSSFGGVGYGHYDTSSNQGKATNYTYSLYGYQADQLQDAHWTVQFADGVTVVDTDHGTYGSDRYPSTRRMIFHHAVKAA